MEGRKFTPGSTPAQSLTAATTGTGSVKAFNDCRQITWMVTGNGTISGGTIKIESSNDQAYAGTWNELDSITASTLTGGAKYINTFPTGGGDFVRARISSDITGGGDVDVELNGILL